MTTGGDAPGPAPAFPWDAALHLGLHRLGWRPRDFWAATPRELIAAAGTSTGAPRTWAPQTWAAPTGADLARLLAAHPDPD
ncbi:phage tail assembly chaperone [Methylobacterium sp. A54F]